MFAVKGCGNGTKLSLVDACQFQLTFLLSQRYIILQGYLRFFLRYLKGSSLTTPQSKVKQKVHRQSSPSMQTQNTFHRKIQGRESLHQIICPSLLAEIYLLLMAIQEITKFTLSAFIKNSLFFIIFKNLVPYIALHTCL